MLGQKATHALLAYISRVILTSLPRFGFLAKRKFLFALNTNSRKAILALSSHKKCQGKIVLTKETRMHTLLVRCLDSDQVSNLCGC